jgi:two-component system nitrate/nitrite response regulator NarL
MDGNGREHAGRGNAPQQLSERERQILSCLTRGESYKLIARNCSIAEATVKVHLKTILRKIAVSNRTQAALWALAHGVLVNHDDVPLDKAFRPILERKAQNGPGLIARRAGGELGNC